MKNHAIHSIVTLLSIFFALTLKIQYSTAQIIYGPNSASIGRYYVDTVDVDIKYKWIIEGGYISDSIGIYDDTVVIHWTDTIRKIQVIQIPQFANNFLHVDSLGANGNDTLEDNIAFQKGVDSLFQLGGGTLYVDSGTYYIDSVFLRAGVKIQGIDTNKSVLRRPWSTTYVKYQRMLTTYAGNGALYSAWYTFVPTTSKNSKPIEICNLKLDANLDSVYTDTLEHAALIYLQGLDSIIGGQYLNNNYIGAYVVATGSGKLKAFVHDCAFKNCPADAVNIHCNVDIHYSNCTGENIYRGTITVTGGNTIADIKKIKTYGASNSQKGIDLEKDNGQGFNNNAFRVWIDSTEIQKGAQFDYKGNTLLVTNTTVQPGSFVFEGNMGDLIANNCNFSYFAVEHIGNNYMLGPSCGRYYNCNFTVFNSADSCNNFNGMLFRNVAGGPILESKLGFQNCAFEADSASFSGNPYPKFGIYKQNQASNYGQFFFKNCTNVNNSLDSILGNIVPIGPGSPPICQSSNQTFQSNVVFKDSMLVCGETEDEMKAHFGYRIVGIDSNFKCNIALFADTTVHKYDSPKASELIALYGNDTLKNKKFYIDSTFSIDTDITFIDCQLWFTNIGAIKLQAGNHLNIDSSTILQEACESWNGIEADSVGQKITMRNNSIIKGATVGIKIINNAVVETRNSTYRNNLSAGIWFADVKDTLYKNIIVGNLFTSDTAINGNGNPTFTGIFISNSTAIEIGDSSISNSGNTFNTLLNGVIISGDANMPNILANNTSRIGMYNNQFNNITNPALQGGYPTSQKINGCYNVFSCGASVFANYGMVPSTFDARIDVRNTNDTNTVIRFENCDKAIVTKNASLKAKNLYVQNNIMGIMCNGTTSKKLEIQNNHINKAVIGMQFIGNNTDSYVKNNTIDSLYGTATGLYTNYWGMGIDVRHFTNADTSTFEVKENNITVDGFAGRGINMENTGKNVHVLKNDIALTLMDTGVIYCIGATLLNGINATNISKSVLYKNTVTGTDSINASLREDITGILINNSVKPRIECNIAERTRFGISAISECLTDTDGVRGNTVNEQTLGWVFRHLGSEGSFGNVGTEYNDNHNLWTGNLQQYKVFKFCEDQQNFRIFTQQNFLEQQESNSFNIVDQTNNTCRYLVQDNAGASIYTCPINFNFQEPFNVNSAGTFPHDEAIAIATHTKSYSEYPEIAYWMDARKLYKDLDNSSTYRNGNDTLLAFYDSLNTAIIEHINATETNIANLIQSMNSQNYELYLQRLEEANSSNSNVVSEEDQEINEHDINEIYIKMITYGIDSLNAEDSSRIAEIANLCPYIGGTAVYKARSLYSIYYPANMFDDIALCNAIGVYKQDSNNGNSKGIFDEENTYLQSLKPKENVLVSTTENKFMLFPNPANENINIKYQLNRNQIGNVVICDLLGRQRMIINLATEINHVTANINSLETGVFIYKYFVNYNLVETGKLLKE